MAVRKFLVIADDSPELQAALRYACRRASATGGRVSLLRCVEPVVMEHWAGVRDEMERQTREEAEAELQSLADAVMQLTGHPAELLIREGNAKAGIRAVCAQDPDIKVLVLAAAVGGRGPGALVSSVGKDGVGWGGRRLAVTIVPGDLTEAELDDLG